ncbi:hypothetical protein [Bacillus niameyensis]|uniref:hypothetical protein n=1 Tax=Bacillus niameyensis TaxID=1522308 RepID=UPI0007864F7F|nr:hypothetical protein [Bacillus niameyensis]
MVRMIIIIIVSLIIVTGCVNKIPEPETIIVEASEVQKDHSLFSFRHMIQGNDVKIECIVPTVSFNKNDDQAAKIRLYIDNRFYNEYDTAAFVVKNVQAGPHNFRMEVVSLENQSLGLSRNFLVTIP